MQHAKEIVTSLINKESNKTTSTTSKEAANIKIYIPDWLATLFRMFAVNYRQLWTDPLHTEQMRQATNCLWLNALQGFSKETVLKAGEQAIKTLKYPPTIAQFLEIAIPLRRHENFDKEIIERQKNRLLEKKPNKEIAKKYMAEIKKKLNIK